MFSNLCLTLALLTNAVIIGSATNLLSNMDAGAVAKKNQLDGINGYMRFRKVGGEGKPEGVWQIQWCCVQQQQQLHGSDKVARVSRSTGRSVQGAPRLRNGTKKPRLNF